MSLDVGAAPASPELSSVAVGTPAVDKAAGDSGAVAPPVDPRAGVNELAQQFGYAPEEFAHFPDVVAATAAIRWQTEKAAHFGLDAQQSPPQAPQSRDAHVRFAGAAPADPVQPTAAAALLAAIDLKALGVEDDEPVAKVVRALEKQMAGLNPAGTVKELADRMERFETAQRTAAVQRIATEVNSAVDALKSPKYGVFGRQTPVQRMATDRLKQYATVILEGERRLGRPDPSLGALMARAKMLDEMGAMNAAPVVPQPPVLPTANPGTAPAMEGVKFTEKWTDNPQMLARLGISG